jgi:hypothetical protein
MKPKPIRFAAIPVLALLVLLSACGGGGGGSRSTPPAPPPAPSSNWDQMNWDSGVWA